MKKQYKILSVFVIFLFLAISVNAGEEFWGSSTSNRYHFPTCQWAKKINPAKRIVFHSPEEAIKAGYEPCPVCRPPLVSMAANDEKEKANLANIKKDATRLANTKNVLFVTAANPDYPATSSFINAVKSKLDEDSKKIINYSYEYLHPNYYYPDAEQEAMLVSFLKQKYQNQQPDIVVAHLAPLINKYADAIFPEVPVIYSVSENDFNDPRTAPYFMSYQGVYDLKKALQVIAQLQPEIKKIYVVLGDSEEERKALSKIAKATQEYESQIEFVYLNKQPFAETLKLAGTLDNKSAILYVSVFRDVEGKTFVSRDTLRLLHKEASAPIYGIGGQYIGDGSTGGYILNREVQGKHAAGIATQILNGKKITEIQPENVSFGEYAFDWRELKQWKINERKLPQESRIEYRQNTAWDLYKWQIVMLLLIIALVIALVLLMNSRSKKNPTEIVLSHLQPEENAIGEMPIQQPEIVDNLTVAAEIHPVTVAATVEAATLNDQPDAFSGIDSLTGLYDRRQMEETIREEVYCFQKNAKTFSQVAGNDIFKDVKSFSLMIGDIDFFQKINEAHGREAADALLKSLAEDLQKMLRACDMVARWREEEFLFLLPEISLDGAKAVAERIRKKIEEQSYACGNIKLSATMTFGVSTIRINDTANDLLKRVDNALFKGKNTGGNCVVSA